MPLFARIGGTQGTVMEHTHIRFWRLTWITVVCRPLCPCVSVCRAALCSTGLSIHHKRERGWCDAPYHVHTLPGNDATGSGDICNIGRRDNGYKAATCCLLFPKESGHDIERFLLVLRPLLSLYTRLFNRDHRLEARHSLAQEYSQSALPACHT